MARLADPLKAVVHTQLLQHLGAGADIDLVRAAYPKITLSTWKRWSREAVDEHIKAGGKPPKRQAGRQPGQTLLGSKASKDRAKKKQAAAMQQPKEGRHIPAGEPDPPAGEDDAPPTMGIGNSGLGNVTKDETYIVRSMFSATESSIVTRWTDPPELRAEAALGVLDRLNEQYHNAEALLKASIKRAGAGHAILEPKAYADAVDLMRKITVDYMKVLKEYRSIDVVKDFIDALVSRIKSDAPPEVALALLKVVRDTAAPFTTRPCPPAIQQPSILK